MSNPLNLPDIAKSTLRVTALAARDALSDEYRAAAAKRLALRGLPLAITPGTIVAGYAPIRSEIDPHPLMRKLAGQGAQLALPVILGRDLPLQFRVWSPRDTLQRGPLGILQPSSSAVDIIPDVLLIPLAAFDRSGHRIGYGAGYYDRTLAQLRASKPITALGIAFAAQEIPVVSASAHDARLDLMLTEIETIDFRSS
jgi:5-formyltetrahydrofolate cyclo-ligase